LAASDFDQKLNPGRMVIPACVTATVIATTVWLQSPARIESLSSKSIISDCYAALAPNTELMTRFLAELENLKAQARISVDEYLWMRSSRVARDLLDLKTLGDWASFDNRTAQEILDEVRAKLTFRERQRLAAEQEIHRNTRDRLTIASGANARLLARMNGIATIFARIVSRGVFLVLLPVIIVGVWYSYVRPNASDSWVSTAIIVAFGLLTVFSMITGAGLLGICGRVQRKIHANVYALLIGRIVEGEQ
jgi:hypothetical protein